MARLPVRLSERAARLSIRARLLLLVLALGLPFLAYIAIEAAAEARADRELPSHINNVAVWTLSGANVGSLNPQTRIRGISVADRRYFKDAIASRKLALEAPVVGRTNGELLAIFARPVVRGDSVLGVVSASTQLKHVQGFLDREGSLPRNSVITVIDPQGIVLARSVETDKWLGKNVSDQEAIRTSLLQGEGVAESAGVDTVARLYGYTTARSVPWLVYVGIPHESALTPVWL